MKLTKYLAIAFTALFLLTAASSSWATWQVVNGQWVYVDSGNDRSGSYDNDNDNDNDNDHSSSSSSSSSSNDNDNDND